MMKNTLPQKLMLTTSLALLLFAAPAIAAEEAVPAEDLAEITALDSTGIEPTEQEMEQEQIPTISSIGETISMDRSDWPVIEIAPADGSVTYHPTYMGSVPMGEDEVSPLHAPDPVWQIQEALRGANAENYSHENTVDLITQPFIGLGRFVLMPFEMVIEHPWSEKTSE